MSNLAIDLQALLEARISFLGTQSLNLNGDPYGSDTRLRVETQHWIAYQGSTYPDGAPKADGTYTQERELEFVHYVEVQDLRRDYQKALVVHELLLGALAGFRPDLENVRTPLRVVNDGIVSAQVESTVVYRYRATYRLRVEWKPEYELTPAPFTPVGLIGAIWRSFVDEIAADNSVKDADIIVGDVD